MSAASPPGVAAGPLVRELLRLETALANRDAAGIDGGLAALIADDFVEIGASGRRWAADEVRSLVAGQTRPSRPWRSNTSTLSH